MVVDRSDHHCRDDRVELFRYLIFASVAHPFVGSGFDGSLYRNYRFIERQIYCRRLCVRLFEEVAIGKFFLQFRQYSISVLNSVAFYAISQLTEIQPRRRHGRTITYYYGVC